MPLFQSLSPSYGGHENPRKIILLERGNTTMVCYKLEREGGLMELGGFSTLEKHLFTHHVCKIFSLADV